LETTLFRIIKESLTNALRHSNSNRVGILLNLESQQIQVIVDDWCRGFDSQKVAQERFGIQGIRQRVEVFGGQATIDSAIGQGTRIVVEMPFIETCERECLLTRIASDF
jgi:two-component system sensor histidine kinase DegS